MKLFRGDQIKEIDRITIEDEPVASSELMERAAIQLLKWYLSRFDRSKRIFIFTGPGNNGGDGLALARLLKSNRYDVEVYNLKISDKTTDDWNINLLRLQSEAGIEIINIRSADGFPVISADDVIIDGIFGSGLKRPVEGLAAEIIKLINGSKATTISIDIPSGMFCEDNSGNTYESIVSADYTLSFQFPRIAFMFPENARLTGEWFVLPIGLNPRAISSISSSFFFSEKEDIARLLHKRKKFDHKGVFGHGLLIAGSYGKMGAAVIGAEAALRSGIGLLTCHIPTCGIIILQCSLPEAMAEPDRNVTHFSDIDLTDNYNAVGIGPGIGKDPETQGAFKKLLTSCKKPIVIDADGLNILSLNKDWFNLIPAGSILTPHPKEFERFAGKTENSYQRLERQIELSKTYNCVIVLKGANSSITTPSGNVYFNSTGNPGMAKAGSGDALTGILLSLLAQGYNAEHAAILGVYLHGLAGDLAAEHYGVESIIASDIIKCLSPAFKKLNEP